MKTEHSISSLHTGSTKAAPTDMQTASFADAMATEYKCRTALFCLSRSFSSPRIPKSQYTPLQYSKTPEINKLSIDSTLTRVKTASPLPLTMTRRCIYCGNNFEGYKCGCQDAYGAEGSGPGSGLVPGPGCGGGSWSGSPKPKPKLSTLKVRFE